MFQEGWIDNQGVKIHYSQTKSPDADLVSLVLVPGLSEDASDYEDVIERLAPRRVVVVTLRGRGQSDAPERGYRLEDHVRDVEAVVDALGLDNFCLMGYSRGTSYALGYAVQHPEKLKGFIAADYPAHHTALVPEWVDWAVSGEWRGRASKERMPLHAVRGLQAESVRREFWEELRSFAFPVLVLRGAQEGHLLSEEAADRYLQMLPQGELVVFEAAAHDLRLPDAEFYYETLERFATGL